MLKPAVFDDPMQILAHFKTNPVGSADDAVNFYHRSPFIASFGVG